MGEFQDYLTLVNCLDTGELWEVMNFKPFLALTK